MIGSKWKLLIIWLLSDLDNIRFNKFLKLIPSLNKKTLSQKLKELEKDNIISRKVYPEVPPRVEYSLTPKGKTLLPIINDFCNWGVDNAEFDYELLFSMCQEEKSYK